MGLTMDERKQYCIKYLHSFESKKKILLVSLSCQNPVSEAQILKKAHSHRIYSLIPIYMS